MSTTNDHKRRKCNEEEDSDLAKKFPSSAADSNIKEEDDGSDESASSYGSYSSPPTTTFVAWLDNDTSNNNNILSIGELHFSSAEHIAEAASLDDDDEEEEEEGKDDGSYCIVCQLKSVPNDKEDEESDLVYTFKDSFPFRVLKSSSCIVGLPLIPIGANGDICSSHQYDGRHYGDNEKFLSKEEGPFNYMLDGELRTNLLQQLGGLYQSNDNVSPNWKVSIPNEEVIVGVDAWWKAGEAKTGWDLSNIPREDYTTLQTIYEEEKKKGPGNVNNILMSLYKDLCAFEPLVMNDDLTRDMIEDRFEWRTCLWYVVLSLYMSYHTCPLLHIKYMNCIRFYIHVAHIICSFSIQTI